MQAFAAMLNDLGQNSMDGSSTYDMRQEGVRDIIADAQPFLEGLGIALGDAPLSGYMGMPKLHHPEFDLHCHFRLFSAATGIADHTFVEGSKDRFGLAVAQWRSLHFTAGAEMCRAWHFVLRNSTQLMPDSHAFNMLHILQHLDSDVA